jgi:glycosyltransferase involved in cell wall biosynthesis
MGGVETYTIDLINELAKSHDVAAFLPSEYGGEYTDLTAQVGVHTFKTGAAKKLRRVSHRLAEATCFNAPMSLYRPDIIHVPFQILRHEFRVAPVVVSIMDIQHEYFPEYFGEDELASRRSSYLDSITAADHVIAISNFTKETLVEKLNIDSRKITVVHLSHDASIFHDAISSSDTLSLPQRYFYYPAATWKHKNHIRLIHAFSKYRKETKDHAAKLVFSGVRKAGSDPIQKRIQKLGLEKQIIWLGHIDRALLPHVYKQALGLVYPSEFEGFGIPLLEAMAVGCPVAASDCTSIPEIAGAAAMYFDPTNVSEIVAAMKILGGSSSKRAKLIAAGLKQAKLFSQKRMLIYVN